MARYTIKEFTEAVGLGQDRDSVTRSGIILKALCGLGIAKETGTKKHGPGRPAALYEVPDPIVIPLGAKQVSVSVKEVASVVASVPPPQFLPPFPPTRLPRGTSTTMTKMNEVSEAPSRTCAGGGRDLTKRALVAVFFVSALCLQYIMYARLMESYATIEQLKSEATSLRLHLSRREEWKETP